MRCHTLQKIGLPLITLASCRTVLTEKLTSHIPKCPPPVPVLNQLDPVHTLTSHFLKDPSLYYSPIYTLVLQMVSFPPAPHQNPVHTSAIPHTCYMPRPSHSSRFDEEYRSLSSSLCSFLHFPVTSSLLAPNILLSTPFSNTLSLHSFLNVSVQVSHPYKTKGKIRVLYILIFKCLYSKHSVQCTKPNRQLTHFTVGWDSTVGTVTLSAAQIPARTRFSALADWPWSPPASCTMGTGSLSRR